MSDHHTYYEHHGYPVNSEGKKLTDKDQVHVRICLDMDPNERVPYTTTIAIIEDLTREDGTCKVCRPNPTLVRGKASERVEAALRPCVNCGMAIAPGQLYYGGPNNPHHFGCHAPS